MLKTLRVAMEILPMITDKAPPVPPPRKAKSVEDCPVDCVLQPRRSVPNLAAPPLPSRPKSMLNNMTPGAIFIDDNWTFKQAPFEDFNLSIRSVTRDVAFYGDMVIVAEMMNVRAYSLKNGKPIWSSVDYIKPNCFRVKDNLVVVGCTDGHVLLMNASDGRVLVEHLAAHGKNCLVSITIAQSNQFLTIDENGTIVTWDKSGRRLNTLQLNRTISLIALNSEKAMVALGKSLTLMDLSLNTLQEYLTPVGVGSVSSITAFDDGFVTGHEDGKFIFWKNGDPLVYTLASCFKIQAILGIDGFLWTGDALGTIRVIDLKQKKVLLEWKSHNSCVSKLISNENFVLSLDTEGVLGLWDRNLLGYRLYNQIKKDSCNFSKETFLNMRVCSWNVGACRPPVDLDFYGKWLGNEDDLIAISLQEIVDLSSASNSYEEATQWTERLQAILSSGYYLVESQVMVGLMLLLFCKKSTSAISVVEASQVKTGLGGLYGNKGGIGVRLLIEDTSFCFVACHLAAGQGEVAARNSDLVNIMNGLKFEPLCRCKDALACGGDGSCAADHQNVLLFGDLNYRIDREIDYLIEQKKFEELRRADQLLSQRELNPSSVLKKFEEIGELNFTPTYKYERHTDKYDAERTPAWCDRVLIRTQDKLALKEYKAVEDMRISDHKPIYAQFTLPIRTIDRKKRAVVGAESLLKLLLQE